MNDTFAFVKRLEEVGFTRAQAEASVEMTVDAYQRYVQTARREIDESKDLLLQSRLEVAELQLQVENLKLELQQAKRSKK